MNPVIFSIIIPTYNASKTLQKAIDSVLGQTFEDFEIIIIDGRSSDSTVEIIEKVSNKYQQVRFLSEKDKGIYDAMNKGIALAKGDWLYFLGSDDFLFDNDVLTRVYLSVKEQDVELLYGNIYKQETGKIYDGEFDLNKLLKRNISHQAMFFNKNIFITKGNFNISYRSHADWDFNIRCFSDTDFTAKFINITVANFAYGGASTTNDIPFLRNSLLPAKLKQLERLGTKSLLNITEYDQWWRLTRNSKIFKENNLDLNTNNPKIDKLVKNIISFQRSIPEQLLIKGILSKLFMTISYLSNRLSNSI